MVTVQREKKMRRILLSRDKRILWSFVLNADKRPEKKSTFPAYRFANSVILFNGSAEPQRVLVLDSKNSLANP